LSEVGSEKWLAKHGILPDVWKERPYVRYSPDNLQPILDEYEGLADDQRKFAQMVARGGKDPYKRDNLEKYPKGHEKRVDAGGFLIMRQAPPGLERFGKVHAEIRPDNAVATKLRTWEYHGPRPYPPQVKIDAKTGRPCKPKEAGGGPIAKSRLHTPESMYEHIRRDKFEDDHFPGDPRLDEVHSHQDVAKYCFISGAWVTQRRQRKDGSWYESQEKDESDSIARRLDLHQWAADRLKQGVSVIYFVLEGCIKADAVLSEIIRQDLDATVVSVPSVTLWYAGEDGEELEEFAARHLLGKQQVPIVCDSDGARNDRVRTQALLLSSFLRNRGVQNVEIVAPPYPGSRLREKDWRTRVTQHSSGEFVFETAGWAVDPDQLDMKGKPLLNGVDDHVGAGRGLGELKRLGNQVSEEILQWVLDHPRKNMGKSWKADAFDAVALEGICSHAVPPNGDFPYWNYCSSAEMNAKVLEIDEPQRAPARVVPYKEPQKPSLPARIRKMQRAMKDSLPARGAIEKISGSEEVKPKRVRTSKGWRLVGYDYPDGQRPRYRIVPKELEPSELVRRPLSEIPEADYYNRVADFLEERARVEGKETVNYDAIGEMQMLATDDHLAHDAEDLAEIAGSLLEMAIRWQTRFPTSRVLEETVERFLAELQAAA
jgi:hypothetical protein